ncbi:Precorrin-3B methylase [Halalkaliarchaeum sp. AArc-CO]|uniref:precorrin-3B C(17)-methyltransferase n=1 Tax=unclassified Halalkaliarchaeum TaxID=2678344 RepID=UPI00217F13F3|nr:MULTISPECIES: SAM-dependent methyltransferase [unclassified Halalkaliarchaeum]MDR5673743.1 SAM-dependent methyltransferase [Halalkaliarchaeum sp. AArc-GB]UWG52119.1 Precorrin-3B methylase [Halalkaliarchaeum sp. AArc-CO]
MTGDDSPSSDREDDYGTLYVVGIGPGLPEHATRRAQEVIRNADCVIVADLYRRFLCEGGILPPAALEDDSIADGDGTTFDEEVVVRESGHEQTLVRSSMGRQRELAELSVRRVRDGEDVVHVSGGDPNVYGKADLLFSAAQQAGAEDLPIEVVPGVTAATGAAAALGAPLSNDFCTVSLSERWRPWDEIGRKLRAAAESGFVIVLYNPRGNHRRALATIREERAGDVPVAVVTDVGRKEAGRVGERRRIATLEELLDNEDDGNDGNEDEASDDGIDAMATTLVVGNAGTEIREFGGRRCMFTPRGDREITDF